MQYIAFDSHTHYPLARVEDAEGHRPREAPIAHERGALKELLLSCDPGSPVAVETVGNWYWMVDEILAAGCLSKLVHAHKAKLMIGMMNQTDKLDARGLHRRPRAGNLPEVWIPQGPLWDKRKLPRTRMVLVQQRMRLKNHLHATIAKHGVRITAVNDLFGRRGRQLLEECLQTLPPHTVYISSQLLAGVDALDLGIAVLKRRMQEVFRHIPDIELLHTLPGVGFILAVVIGAEVGDVRRFAHP
jgi:transposase